MPIQIYDQSNFATNDKWTDFASNGTNSLNSLTKSMSRPQAGAAFNDVGTIRSGIPGVLNQVYQVDFRVTRVVSGQATGLLGLRDDATFNVTGPMIYIFISNATDFNLDVRTFPANAPQNITRNQWYTAKLKIITDNVEVYIHGGPEGYNNVLLGTGPHSGIQSATIYFNANIAQTPPSGGGLYQLMNYAVTDSLAFSPTFTNPANLSTHDFLFKEKY